MKKKIEKKELLGKTIDIHTHAGGINFTNYYLSAFPYCSNISDLILNMNVNNIDYSVTFPVPTNINTKNSPMIDKELRRIIQKYEKHPYYYENMRLLKEAEIFGDNKILPFIMLSLYSKIDLQIESYYELMEKYPIYGFKINASTDCVDIKEILHNEKLKLFLVEQGLPIMFHSSQDLYCSGENILSLAKELPSVRMCAAHLGRLDQNILDYINRLDNLWFDFSPVIKLFDTLKQTNSDFFAKTGINKCEDLINYLYKKYDSKLLYGSDYPWCYCGYLDSFVNNNLSHIYDENVKVLKKLPKKTQKTVLNVNAINYLYGGHKYD